MSEAEVKQLLENAMRVAFEEGAKFAGRNDDTSRVRAHLGAAEFAKWKIAEMEQFVRRRTKPEEAA